MAPLEESGRRTKETFSTGLEPPHGVRHQRIQRAEFLAGDSAKKGRTGVLIRAA